jgi:hypothetical protein
MPQTLIGRLWLIALLAALTVPYMLSHAGSVPPLTEKQATEMVMTASSQKIMQEFCADLDYDIKGIAGAMSDGMPIEELKGYAERAKEALGDERFARIMKMIDEAYTYKGPIGDWMDATYSKCADI